MGEPLQYIILQFVGLLGFTSGSDGKESVCNAGDLGSIPGLGRSPHPKPVNYLFDRTQV